MPVLADSEAKAAIHSWIEQADGYAENKPYFDSLLDQAHEAAFKSTYEIGSRRRSAKFDAKEYAQQVFSAMKSKAESDGRAPIAQAIEAVWSQYRAATPSDSK